ncbi:hypothetical protein EJ03DRAFT_283259 [Teratosphaeria nubilosa]|uniref:Alpha-1,2-mannosyltransferase n=1 Tax=Teratosphaeria nubilosa TaxID=161662 RepID=A0A6G1KTB4_9PEZI|nr:hypothetical protein EJ03DRAFT_283259 [Teratosphaeria nubilosa]
MYGFLLLAGLVITAASACFLALNRKEQDVVLQSPNRPSPAADYSLTFPPDRRHALAGLPLQGCGESADELSQRAPNYRKRVPICSKADAADLGDHVTATGFTVNEIKRLGDFPDYAALSGIPLPQAYKAFDISIALPRPYRPLRWAYHQTMSLTKMEPDWWLELESTYSSRIAQRTHLLSQHGTAVLSALPGSELAAQELMEMCLQFLCARYPHYFTLDLATKTFHNGILNTHTNLHTTEPLHVLMQNVPEDFALMLRDPATGLYYCRGGIICSSLGWNLGTKAGLSLAEIHGPVPDYSAKMSFSMDRYFARKPTDKAIQRGSWGLEIDQPLYMPPGDPHEEFRGEQNPSHTIERCYLRVDWQTLRRLPLSGAIVFNFKALFTPVPEFRDEPYIPSLLLRILREGKENLMAYKNPWHTEHVVIPELERYEREQEEEGLVKEEWEPTTLGESPFFPGWEAKWQRQQGF